MFRRCKRFTINKQSQFGGGHIVDILPRTDALGYQNIAPGGALRRCSMPGNFSFVNIVCQDYGSEL
jgi:hypothetical protein